MSEGEGVEKRVRGTRRFRETARELASEETVEYWDVSI